MYQCANVSIYQCSYLLIKKLQILMIDRSRLYLNLYTPTAYYYIGTLVY